MKDCGIFSIFYRNYNYGGQLQAYGMCKAIEKMGFSSEQICYIRDKSFLKHKVIVVLKKTVKEKKDLARRYVNRIVLKLGVGAKYTKKTIRKFDQFMKAVPHSNIYYSYDIKNSEMKYQCFISGSDQVWNPDTCSDEWFLNFLDNKKPRIAYSASIGKEYFTEEEQYRLKPLIEKYQFIGVRENKAKELVEQYTNKSAEVVLDPVMLLSKDEWSKFDKWNFLKNEEYICVYLVAYNKKIERQALAYANKLNKKAVFITDPRNVLNQNPKGYWTPFKDGVGPEEFIALLLNAKLVITNSFHGIALSINFGKNFWAYYSRAVNDKNTLNSRIDTVLDTFELKDRLTNTEVYLNENKLMEEIDYQKVFEILNNRRYNCAVMLKNAIERSL